METVEEDGQSNSDLNGKIKITADPEEFMDGLLASMAERVLPPKVYHFKPPSSSPTFGKTSFEKLGVGGFRCSGIELKAAYHALVKIAETIKNSDTDDCEVEGSVVVRDHFYSLLEWMRSKVLTDEIDLESYHVSHDDNRYILDDLNIKLHQHFLRLKPGHQTLLEESKQRGADAFMSSENMYKFLNMLVPLTGRSTDASCHTWFDAFLFRAAAMMPDDQHMAISQEYKTLPLIVSTRSLESKTKLVGFTDYTVVIANSSTAIYYANFHPKNIKNLDVKSSIILSLVETKARSIPLDVFLPQVLAQMYTSVKNIGKKHIRGVLSDGYEWLFVILTLNADGNGATYRRPNVKYSVEPFDRLPNSSVIDTGVTDFVSAMLASWILHSFEDLGENDLLEDQPIEGGEFRSLRFAALWTCHSAAIP